ncbi:hypothetical protein BL240_15815 [Pseudomonas putida]|uniref:Uncharacterized protein n=1 Tax=Pseudomonas putida TaxID=303 RepID=A0A1L5PRN9_PSEPU|nr:hypothetical protein BL240_15815 [Pseudomonas putida]
MGAGLPAKQAPRWMAPAVPVFAGEPAPTMIAVGQNDRYGSKAPSYLLRSGVTTKPLGNLGMK